MIKGLKGTIVGVGLSSIDIDVHDVVYEVLTPHPDRFSIGEETTLYTHEVITQDDHYLAGFPSKEESQSFDYLISVKGVGPKTALNALTGTTPELLAKAIESEDVRYLKKLPGIGPKASQQIILDLKGKLVSGEATPQNGAPSHEQARQVLKQMGYKSKEIDDALKHIEDPNLTDQQAVLAALKFLRKS